MASLRSRVLPSHSLQPWTFNSKAATKGHWLKPPLWGVRLWFSHYRAVRAGYATDNQLFRLISRCRHFCPLSILRQHRSCIRVMRACSRGFYHLHNIIINRRINLNHLHCWPFFIPLMSNDTVATVLCSKSARPLTPQRGVIAPIAMPLCLRVQRDFTGSEFHSINLITEFFHYFLPQSNFLPSPQANHKDFQQNKIQNEYKSCASK